MSGIWLPVSALTISLFLVIIFYTKKHEDNEEVKIYKKLLIVSLICSFNAVLVYIVAKTTWNNTIVGFMQKLHLSLLNVIAYYLLGYNLAINNFESKRLSFYNILSFIYTVVTIILVFVFPLTIINEGEVLDLNGQAYYVSITGIVLYFSLLILTTIKYFLDSDKDLKKTIPFIVLIVMFVLGLFLRMYFPEIITETYCISFALLGMYFTIENPDIKMLNEVSMARDKAEKANAAKTDFLSSMSHEIRTPLNGIVGFSQAILEEEDLEAAKQDARDIIESSNSLLEIVNGILNISKLESNKMEIINKDYDLRGEIASIMKLIKTKIGEKPIELSLYIAEDVPKCLYGDKEKLKEILINLLTNAVKYTEKGFINVNINCINKNGYCSLIASVEDSGRGIKPDKINKLFEKFERLEEDRNTTIEGAGLGLAITKKLIELMDGSIVVQSVFGSGSKFTFYLKQKISEEKIVHEIEETDKNLIFENKKVLIVDDNELNLKIADKLLSKYSLKVTTCTSGYECLDLINSGKDYDLILLDDMMPRMSGTETLKIIKEQNKYLNKVVVLTANAIEGMRDKYLENGFDDYLSKPIDKKELEKILKRCLNNKIEHIDFEPLPDSLFDISDTIILKMNQDKDPTSDSIDDLTPDIERTRVIEKKESTLD